MNTPSFRMPAEWEKHRATWIAWPYLESDYPGKLDAVRWAYCEMIRHLARHERVEILVYDEVPLGSEGDEGPEAPRSSGGKREADLRQRLKRQQITGDINITRTPYNRSWLRDSGPIGVVNDGLTWLAFTFTGWGALPEVELDQKVPERIAFQTGVELVQPTHESVTPVIEGGMLDVSGDGLVLVTEQCLLSDEQQRNESFTKQDYEKIFSDYLGAPNTIWLPWGVAGDDTHGHIDNVARFVGPRTVVVSSAPEHDTEQYSRLQENIEVLRGYRTPTGERLTVVELPFPEPRYCDGVRWGASYANFYFANDLLLVPTYNDENDRKVLQLLADLVPDRKVIGINCSDWILGGGTLHCSTQQEPGV